MIISGTKENRVLANAVNSRVSADARMVKAKAALWTLGGVGLMSFGVGAGAALVIFAYARFNDKNTAANQLAEVLTKSLMEAKLTAVIDPSSTVKLDNNATVKMAPGSEVVAKGTVGIDPNSRVNLVGGAQANLPRPTLEQLRDDAVPQSKAHVTTDYTVFKNVKFGKGSVITGFQFAPDSDAPKGQFCYYTEANNEDDTSTRIDLARNTIFRPQKIRGAFDPRAAATSCVWYDGSSTIF